VSLLTGFRLCLLWLLSLNVLAAVDLGMAMSERPPLAELLTDQAYTIASLLCYAALVVGLRSRLAAAWVGAGLWMPTWIAWSVVDVSLGRDSVLALVWTPVLLGTAVALRFLMRDEVRLAFGLTSAWWGIGRWLALASLMVVLYLPLTSVLDQGVALMLCLSLLLIGATAGKVYGRG
jgi:hypothetical protein